MYKYVKNANYLSLYAKTKELNFVMSPECWCNGHKPSTQEHLRPALKELFIAVTQPMYYWYNQVTKKCF